MKPRIKIATTRTPDDREMELYEHDGAFSIQIGGHELMNSRQHESELELARLGCAHLAGRATPRVLIGGLGLGFTLRQTLDLLGPRSEVVVSELLDPVVEWNRTLLKDLNGRLLEDKRVELQIGDVVDLISGSAERFDTILLDIDNGPAALSSGGNQRLYGPEGMGACRRALRDGGCLALWSAQPSKSFERLLTRSGLCVRRYRVSAYRGSKTQSRFVWVASENERALPPGGGEPRATAKKEQQRGGGRGRGRRFSSGR